MKREETSRLGVGCSVWLDFFGVFHNNNCSDRSTASRAKSFDDDLAILFELDWIKHAEIRLLARVVPGVCDEERMLRRMPLPKPSRDAPQRLSKRQDKHCSR